MYVVQYIDLMQVQPKHVYRCMYTGHTCMAPDCLLYCGLFCAIQMYVRYVCTCILNHTVESVHTLHVVYKCHVLPCTAMLQCTRMYMYMYMYTLYSSLVAEGFSWADLQMILKTGWIEVLFECTYSMYCSRVDMLYMYMYCRKRHSLMHACWEDSGLYFWLWGRKNLYIHVHVLYFFTMPSCVLMIWNCHADGIFWKT